MRTNPYPSDLTDAQWTIIGPSVPPAHDLGRPRKTDLREVIDAISYRSRNGCTWRALPRDFPPWRTAYNDFQQWRDDGIWAALNGGKRIKGRKRHIVVDTLGLLLAVAVTAASADDGTAAPRVLGRLSRESFPRLKKLWGDNTYHNHALEAWVSEHGWYVIEVKGRPPGDGEFKVIKWRRVVGRTFAWLGRCRIHSRDYERKAESSEAGEDQYDPQLMLRRLPGESYGSPFRYPRSAYKIAA